MDDVNQSTPQQVGDSQSAEEIKDLPAREDTAEVKGGALTSDPDEGGQVAPAAGQPVYRLAANSNETLVEDNS